MDPQVIVLASQAEGLSFTEVPLTQWQYFSYGLFMGACMYVLTLRPFRFRDKPAEVLAINVLIQGFFYLVMWHANGYVSGHVTFILGGIAGAAIISAIHKLVIENSVQEGDKDASSGKSEN